jgi:hypothetical protein
VAGQAIQIFEITRIEITGFYLRFASKLFLGMLSGSLVKCFVLLVNPCSRPGETSAWLAAVSQLLLFVALEARLDTPLCCHQILGDPIAMHRSGSSACFGFLLCLMAVPHLFCRFKDVG